MANYVPEQTKCLHFLFTFLTRYLVLFPQNLKFWEHVLDTVMENIVSQNFDKGLSFDFSTL